MLTNYVEVVETNDGDAEVFNTLMAGLLDDEFEQRMNAELTAAMEEGYDLN